ncbi:MAG TPA: methyltransferase domain-containing protein, partial [Candidatus Methylomirabilis sp.]|nr:methyltransferase domain-containing protein [Candidatus Methylomirabilis sp.]
DEERDFYGRQYWFAHQERQLGNPTIVERARADLPERCLYWLRALLKYRVPPGRVVEVGSGHGGFAALLRWAGFEATGLEISPWVVDFARHTFDVPVLLGPIEDQGIEPGSLDIVVLMDVLEHLRDPVATMRRCLALLKPDGLILIQTPSFDAGKSYEDMVERGDRFREILQPREHLFLFSRPSVAELFSRLGAGYTVFEPALFDEYDMFLLVSRAPIRPRSGAAIEAVLARSSSGRMVQALLDLGRQLDELAARHAVAEADRAARLEVMEEQGRKLGEVEAERNVLRAELTARLEYEAALEAERVRAGEAIQEQTRRLGELAAERDGLRVERDGLRVERGNLRIEVEAQEQQIQAVLSQMRALQRVVSSIESGRAYRILRRLGFWQWFEREITRGG